MQSIIALINQYGYIVLFGSLVLELVALPLPGEIMMTYYGFLVYQMKMNWIISIFIAATGASLGITISYLIGNTLGFSFFHKYGHYIHLGPDKLDKTSRWFQRYGNKLLLIAYFIPGVRHITGYFSGITKISYKRFALNAYLGAFIWASAFISLGKVLGPNWEKFHGYVKKYMIIGSLTVIFIYLTVYMVKKNKDYIREFIYNSLNKTMKIFHSLGRIKIAIAGVAAVFLVLSGFVIGLIQDYLGSEFEQFDTIVNYIFKIIFTDEWRYAMNLFENLTSLYMLILITALIITFVSIRKADRFLEIRTAAITIWGGVILEVLLRLIFRRLGPFGVSAIGTIKYTFPSEQALLSIVTYGFACYIILRHTKYIWIKNISFIMAIAICLLAGLSPLFYEIQYPSDIAAGYVFGGVWLSLNIVLLEIYRVLPKAK